MQDRVDHQLVTELRIDHQVVERAVWPYLAEVAADERGALCVNFFDELRCFLLTFSEGHHAADFFFGRRKDENVERVGAVLQNERRAAAQDDAVAARGDIRHNLAQDAHHAVRVEHTSRVAIHRQMPLVASSRVHFEKAVEKRIAAFVATLGGFVVDSGYASDFFGEVAIPELPAEALGKTLRDHGAAAAVFPLDRDDSDLHGYRQYTTSYLIRTYWAGGNRGFGG